MIYYVSMKLRIKHIEKYGSDTFFSWKKKSFWGIDPLHSNDQGSNLQNFNLKLCHLENL